MRNHQPAATGKAMTCSREIPRWIRLWVAISCAIVLWDITFLFFRPHSLPGGSLDWVWLPYATYIQVDLSYADLGNSFVKAQGFMSFLELWVYAAGVRYFAQSKMRNAQLFIFSALILTAAKTLLIFVLEILSEFAHTGHASAIDWVAVYFLPNVAWVVVPLLAAVQLGRALSSDEPRP